MSSLLHGSPSDARIDRDLLETRRRANPLIWIGGAGTLVLFAAATYAVLTGIGTFGNRAPTHWAFPITDFVWWIGIGHAGTFISAILLLCRQRWRSSINRLAESMTLFALVQAGLFPLLHLGRPWFAYWLVPYPATMEVWPQFQSPLTWDVGAITTYLTLSVLLWFLGLLPDFGTLRDRAEGRARQVYAVLALGWRGSTDQWRNLRMAQLMLAGLATPLVVSVHSIVSMDFAVGNLGGWHSTLFPPYFVAGAIFSGFAMVLTLAIPIRRVFRLQDYITLEHLNLCAKVMLATGLVVAYAYVVEPALAWYSGEPHERLLFLQERPFGPYAVCFWAMVSCNVVLPQALWFERVRKNPAVLFVLSLVINLGMWLERFVLIVSSESRSFLPATWGDFLPSLVDLTILGGTLSFFAFLMGLLLRFLPFVPPWEVKGLRHEIARDDEREDERDGESERKEHVSVVATTTLQGLLASLEGPRELVTSIEGLRAAGYQKLEAFTPFPVPEVRRALGEARSRIPQATLLGAVVGAVGAYALLYWTQVIDYPLAIGGHPRNAVPMYVPLAFESAVLLGGLFTFVAFFVASGLPRLWHPLFELPLFRRATQDRYLLAVDAADPRFDAAATRALLTDLGAHGVASYGDGA